MYLLFFLFSYNVLVFSSPIPHLLINEILNRHLEISLMRIWAFISVVPSCCCGGGKSIFSVQMGSAPYWSWGPTSPRWLHHHTAHVRAGKLKLDWALFHNALSQTLDGWSAAKWHICLKGKLSCYCWTEDTQPQDCLFHSSRWVPWLEWSGHGV